MNANLKNMSAIALLLFAVLSGSANAEETTPATQGGKIATVTVELAEKAEVIGRVPVSGTVVPRQEVLVFPQISGFAVEDLLVDVGDTVKAGDILATVSTDALEAQFAQAKAEVARAVAAIEQAQSAIDTARASKVQADATLGRMTKLRSSGSVSQVSVDDAVAAAQTADAQLSSSNSGQAVAVAQRGQAEAQLEIARLNLSRASIVAPTAGLISERNGQIGAIAATGGNPIFKIIRDSTVEVEAEVIETALGQIAVGQISELEIAGVGTVSGSIRTISPTVEPASRLGTIRIAIDQSHGLRTGIFASGWIITSQQQSLTVPAGAVLADTDGTYALLVRDNTVAKTRVSAGLIWDGRREIINGLREGDMVIAKAGAFFADGDVIKPIVAGDTLASKDASR